MGSIESDSGCRQIEVGDEREKLLGKGLADECPEKDVHSLKRAVCIITNGLIGKLHYKESYERGFFHSFRE
jgi:hypothetical protein